VNQSQPSELTVRAVGAGLLVGCLIAASNVVIGLKIGLVFGASIAAAVISFALFKGMSVVLTRPYTPKETLISATTGSAAGFMASAAGLTSAIPAMEMMGTRLSFGQLVIWAIAIAGLGVFFAVPLRRSMIVVDKLRFPSGTASATTIKAMFAAGHSALTRARVLFFSGLGAVVITLLFSIKPLGLGGFQNLGFDDLGLTGVSILGVSLVAMKVGVSFSPMIWGAGILVGPRVGWSLLLGSVAAWLVGGPLLLRYELVGPAAPLKEYSAAFKWLLWPAVSMMIFAGLTGLAFQYRTILKTFSAFAKSKTATDGDLDDAPDRLPFGFWLGGLLFLAGLTVFLAWSIFDISPWMSLLAIVLSFVFCAIAMRAVGETDINPSGPMAKITQLLNGVLDPGCAASNLMTAGITAAGASQGADLMSDFKAGYLLKASIRRQVLAQLAGVLVGAVVVVGVYKALTAAYQIPGEGFLAPSARSWHTVAKVLEQGLAAIPDGALWATLLSGLLGIGLALLGRIKQIAKWVPSPVAIGIAFLVPPYYAIGIWLAALLTWLVRRSKPETVESYSASLASGLIAGEGITMVLIAVLIILGVGWV